MALYRSKGKWKYLSASYGYDAANRLTSINHTNPLGAIEDFVYTYDPNGNRRSATTSNAALPMAAPMSGTSYDEANEMLAHDDFDLVYDNNGNLTSKTNRVTLEATTYTRDARNRLVGISGPSVTASFTYDALNRRIEKAVNGVTTTFVYDGWDIIQETTGSVTTNYTRTLNIDEPLAFERTDGTIRYYVQDALGSVVALTDAEGLVTTTYEYDAFGAVTINGADDQPFQYTGRENDGTGLYYYRARYYSPEMRRFVSEDPIRLRGGINFYAYVGNSPVNYFDPLGLFDPFHDFGDMMADAKEANDNRNDWNHSNDSDEDVQQGRNGWEEMGSPGDWFHQWEVPCGKPNKKYVNKDGEERVYDYNGNLVTDPRNMGTYNYGDNLWEHFWYDMVPYFIWGNPLH